jgi:hypothetical protein
VEKGKVKVENRSSKEETNKTEEREKENEE